MKKVAVLQSNYIPWKGYFDIINKVDEFIFYDDVQYTKNDWRNRNLVLTCSGSKWLTIPIGARNDLTIDEVILHNYTWQKKHYKLLIQSYAKAPFLSLYKDFLEYTFLERKWTSLSELNQFLIKTLSYNYLGIKTKFTNSRDYIKNGNKLDRLLSLLKTANADYYLSGPSAKNYIKEETFMEAAIEIEWMDYSNYPSYPQINNNSTCIHNLSILDLLFNTGNDAPWYIWGWRHSPHP